MTTNFFASRKKNLSKKITITGSHRYDILTEIGTKYYNNEITGIKNLFGDYVLFNDNLAVDHFDKNYTHPMRMFNSDAEQRQRAEQEWLKITNEHTSRRDSVRDFILSVANQGFKVIVRPHPVYDSIYWHHSFRLHPNITTIYEGPVEPWIHASSAVFTSGCTTGIQAFLANRPSFELDIPGVKSEAFSSKILPKVKNVKELFSSIRTYDERYSQKVNEIKQRWYFEGSTTSHMAELIDRSIKTLPNQSNLDELNTLPNLTPNPPKWRSINTNKINAKIELLREILKIPQKLKCKKVRNCLYIVYAI